MAQRINIAELYSDALLGLPTKMDGLPPQSAPQECPMPLEPFVRED
jgi:hypothetical protein